MRTVVRVLILAFTNCTAQAMTCAEFNAMSASGNTAVNVLQSPATDAQVNEFKEVIADHVGRLSFFGFSSKSRAFKFAKNNNMLPKLLGESLVMTRSSCAERPSNDMKDIAIEQFDHLLDAISRGLNRSSETSRDDWGASKHLSAAASELNKTLPMMVDKVTECFVVTPYDHELDFSYRIVTLEASQIHIDINKLKNERTTYACSHPKIRPLIDKGISVRYSYFDKNKTFVISTLIERSDCTP
jgi:hypothetical protein